MPGGADIPVCRKRLQALGRQECLPHRSCNTSLYYLPKLIRRGGDFRFENAGPQKLAHLRRRRGFIGNHARWGGNADMTHFAGHAGQVEQKHDHRHGWHQVNHGIQIVR